MQFIAKAGLTLTATLNYQVLPEVTSELCYKQSQLRVKNCIGVYHQWANNELELYAWYAWRGWCGWWVSHGNILYSIKNNITCICYKLIKVHIMSVLYYRSFKKNLHCF